MGPLWIALAAVVLTALVFALRRRAAARRGACRDELARLLADRRPELEVVEAEAGRWRLERSGQAVALLGAAVVTRAAGSAPDRARLLLAVADAAASGPRPFTGAFDLKEHGVRILPRLADEGLGLLGLDPPPARFTGSAGLATFYLLDGEPRPTYLGETHLDAAGIDARDVHGVAMAVLRQRFDELELRRALDGGAVARIEPADGCGASRLLLVPDALAAGETLFAAAPSPSLLLAATDPGVLEAALAEIDEPTPPLAPGIFRVTASGLRRESVGATST